MAKLYFSVSRNLFLPALLLLVGSTFFSASAKGEGPIDTIRRAHPRLTDTRKDKPAILNTKVHIDFTPFTPVDTRPAAAQPAKTNAPAPAQDQKTADNKIISNVKIYPNPVDDQLNLSYHISKPTNVVIKVMDTLGNEISVLLSQKLQPGEQLNTYNVANKLTKGFYFIHIVAGGELTIKRISVL